MEEERPRVVIELWEGTHQSHSRAEETRAERCLKPFQVSSVQG